MVQFKFAGIFSETITGATGTLPQGAITGFIKNNGAADITLTFANGNTYALEPGEVFELTKLETPYDVIDIDASASKAEVVYTKT